MHGHLACELTAPQFWTDSLRKRRSARRVGRCFLTHLRGGEGLQARRRSSHAATMLESAEVASRIFIAVTVPFVGLVSVVLLEKAFANVVSALTHSSVIMVCVACVASFVFACVYCNTASSRRVRHSAIAPEHNVKKQRFNDEAPAPAEARFFGGVDGTGPLPQTARAVAGGRFANKSIAELQEMAALASIGLKAVAPVRTAAEEERAARAAELAQLHAKSQAMQAAARRATQRRLKEYSNARARQQREDQERVEAGAAMGSVHTPIKARVPAFRNLSASPPTLKAPGTVVVQPLPPNRVLYDKMPGRPLGRLVSATPASPPPAIDGEDEGHPKRELRPAHAPGCRNPRRRTSPQRKSPTRSGDRGIHGAGRLVKKLPEALPLPPPSGSSGSLHVHGQSVQSR